MRIPCLHFQHHLFISLVFSGIQFDICQSALGTMMAILISIACILLAVLILPVVKIGRVYYQAQLIGFPVVVSPIDQSSRFWRLLGNRITPLLKYLPFRLGQFIGFAHFFHDRYSMHKCLGPIYIIVAPGGITLVQSNILLWGWWPTLPFC